MDIIREGLVEKFSRTTLAPSSQKQYVKKLTQWIEHTPLHTVDGLIENSDEAIECLSRIPTIKHTATNHHMYISALVAYLTHIYPSLEKSDEKVIYGKERLLHWKEIQKENNEPMSEHYGKNVPTENQKEKVMPYDAIVKIRDTLESGSFERLLLCFYTMMEPLRADYYAMEIVESEDDSKEENILIRTSAETRILVRDFKTKKRHTKIENKLPPLLHNELTMSLERYPRSYVFVMEDKRSPFTRKLFSNWSCRTLTRVLCHPMTLTVLRHLYISDKVKKETPLDELKEMAKKMGHTRAMQRAYDWS